MTEDVRMKLLVNLLRHGFAVPDQPFDMAEHVLGLLDDLKRQLAQAKAERDAARADYARLFDNVRAHLFPDEDAITDASLEVAAEALNLADMHRQTKADLLTLARSYIAIRGFSPKVGVPLADALAERITAEADEGEPNG